ncbi:uracil phosphoribosyltransferase [Candidatus Babeliales bacterium]|nr:uracil phosphoribosyltransferase [Candidatus Babeliales bacterium]
MKDILLTILRNKDTARAEFRTAAYKLGSILAAETSQFLQKDSFSLKTPVDTANGVKLKNDCILVPILRSGILLMEPFMNYYQGAGVGFVGLRRDEETADPKLYYSNIPKVGSEDNVLVLDPMIATGGSGEAALKILLDTGIKEEKIVFVAVIAAQEGVDRIQKAFPKIKIYVAQIDPELNDKKFIVPGLGDFGDRYFGTE